MSRIPSAALVRAVRGPLLNWFERHQRPMPWRQHRTPYRVWISELMLQQTRVDQVIPYFERFMDRFPDVQALADAPLDEVLKRWEGLGYYARARNAHAAARVVRDRCAGRFPDSVDGLTQLPGIGSYTAAAVASLAFGRDAAVVDGNVVRVISRLLAWALPGRSASSIRSVQTVVDRLLPKGRAGLFNEAMMELGATVCTPRQPNCRLCPLRRVCAGFREGDPLRFPTAMPKVAIPHRQVGAAVILGRDQRILIAKRKAESMLGGLWEFPGGGVESGESVADCIRRELHEELGLSARIGPHLITVRHAFSHFTMDLHVHWARIIRGRPRALGCDEIRWVRREELIQYAFPRADQRVLDELSKVGTWPEF